MVPGCPRSAHLVCHEHPDEGYFCGRHRSAHTRSVAKRNAELDSRPRESADGELRLENLEDLPGATR